MTKIDIHSVQMVMAIASFCVGVIIGSICLFAIPPIGEIASSAMGLVSEFLVLAGALLGIKTAFDAKLKKFEAKMMDKNTEETE